MLAAWKGNEIWAISILVLVLCVQRTRQYISYTESMFLGLRGSGAPDQSNGHQTCYAKKVFLEPRPLAPPDLSRLNGRFRFQRLDDVAAHVVGFGGAPNLSGDPNTRQLFPMITWTTCMAKVWCALYQPLFTVQCTRIHIRSRISSQRLFNCLRAINIPLTNTSIYKSCVISPIHYSKLASNQSLPSATKERIEQ